jgi:hypothetical protein
MSFKKYREFAHLRPHPQQILRKEASEIRNCEEKEGTRRQKTRKNLNCFWKTIQMQCRLSQEIVKKKNQKKAKPVRY